MARWRHHASALAVFEEPDERISFGDIFESDHLIDIYVGSDARALGGGPMPRAAAERIAAHYNLGLTDDADMLAVYTPAMEQHPDAFAVLGRGSSMKIEGPNRAILLTDSCAVDTALVVDRRGRRKHGRLLFAPIVPAAKGDVERLTKQPVFGRFPLEGCQHFEHGAIAELRYAFMVDARAVNVDHRILGLDDETAEDLEVALMAYALRRGPLATERNVERLAQIITQSNSSDLERFAEMVGEVLNISWRLEGALDSAAATSPLDAEKLGRLAADLKALEEAARAAHERLGQTPQ